MNCRPNQRAWICVPATSQNRACGLDQINGRVVETRYVHPRSLPGDPVWVVEPQQTTTAPQTFMSQYGIVRAGQLMVLMGVPDAYLRPFEDFPPEELEVDERELAT